MLPTGKFFDDESSFILQDIKEKEKLANEKIVSLESKISLRGSTLPPLKATRTSSDAERMKKNGMSPLKFDLASRAIKNNDDSVHCRKPSEGKKVLSHHLSFESPRIHYDEARYELMRQNYTQGDSNKETDGRISKSKKDYEEGNRRKYDFDAYLKDAVRKRDEDRLFKKGQANETTVNDSEGRRRERPKTAHYGRRRTHSSHAGD